MGDLFAHPESLLPLLDHLSKVAPRERSLWNEWQIEPVAGGLNNLLYHAISQHGDLAVKFTMRDDWDRAGGEYRALRALHDAGLALAPRAVFLEQARYPQPVVVQTWLEGTNVARPPTSDADWHALIDHYVTIHHLTPERTVVPLSSAVLTMDSALAGRQRIAKERTYIPGAQRPSDLDRLVDAIEHTAFPEWTRPPVTLCRCDPNLTNFIRRSEGWASVDWEYSGWGDPAFEIANLMAHPTYLEVPDAQWPAIVGAYDPAKNDLTFATRVQTYYRLMLVWWATRLTRMLHEATRGLDRRLAPRAANWQAQTEANVETYVRRARAALDNEAIQE